MKGKKNKMIRDVENYDNARFKMLCAALDVSASDAFKIMVTLFYEAYEDGRFNKGDHLAIVKGDSA